MQREHACHCFTLFCALFWGEVQFDFEGSVHVDDMVLCSYAEETRLLCVLGKAPYRTRHTHERHEDANDQGCHARLLQSSNSVLMQSM